MCAIRSMTDEGQLVGTQGRVIDRRLGGRAAGEFDDRSAECFARRAPGATIESGRVSVQARFSLGAVVCPSEGGCWRSGQVRAGGPGREVWR
ncbi:hypothetical protein EMIT0P201_70147 [Pseudomonas chlororaphis]